MGLGGLGFARFAPGHQGRANDDDEHAGPAQGADFLMADEAAGQGGEDKAQRGQRPDEADVFLGEQVEQHAEENGFQQGAEQDVAVGDAARDEAADFGGGDGFHFADLVQALAQKNHAGGF